MRNIFLSGYPFTSLSIDDALSLSPFPVTFMASLLNVTSERWVVRRERAERGGKEKKREEQGIRDTTYRFSKCAH